MAHNLYQKHKLSIQRKEIPMEQARKESNGSYLAIVLTKYDIKKMSGYFSSFTTDEHH